MRLSEREIQVLRSEARHAFGPDVRVFLFGSRVDDTLRGGDIDLLIQTDCVEDAAVFQARISFLARVKLALGERKIDVVLDYPGRHTRPPILDMAKEQGVLL